MSRNSVYFMGREQLVFTRRIRSENELRSIWLNWKRDSTVWNRTESSRSSCSVRQTSQNLASIISARPTKTLFHSFLVQFCEANSFFDYGCNNSKTKKKKRNFVTNFDISRLSNDQCVSADYAGRRYGGVRWRMIEKTSVHLTESTNKNQHGDFITEYLFFYFTK